MEKSLLSRMHGLDVPLSDIEINMDKVLTLAEDLCQDFFGHCDVTPSDIGHGNANSTSFDVLADYNRSATYANILFDYAFDLVKSIKAVHHDTFELYKEMRQEEESKKPCNR